jgi:hypothetical protein
MSERRIFLFSKHGKRKKFMKAKIWGEGAVIATRAIVN